MKKSERLKFGVSACLLGERVRYDGGRKPDSFILGTLGKWVELVPVCPEVEFGLPVPRERIDLVGDPEKPRLVTRNSGKDITTSFMQWTRRRVASLTGEELSAFVFKSRSPSCGLGDTMITLPGGRRVRRGTGIFARTVTERFPLLPVADERHFADPDLRDGFLEGVFVLRRWRAVLRNGKSRRGLLDFHLRHRFFFMSRNRRVLGTVEKILAPDREASTAGLYARYQELLLEALRSRSTPKKHARALRKAISFLKSRISTRESRLLSRSIKEYEKGEVPLLAPLILLRRAAEECGENRLLDQHYFNPEPLEMKLRWHA